MNKQANIEEYISSKLYNEVLCKTFDNLYEINVKLSLDNSQSKKLKYESHLETYKYY